MQVLLVEPCDMVRQVLMLALRAWGTSVCAVKTEEEAISHLNLRSASLPSLTSEGANFCHFFSTQQSLAMVVSYYRQYLECVVCTAHCAVP